MNSKILKYSFLFGCIYFICMAVAHFFGLKYPLLFIYYDTPYYAYQDKIISFAVTAYVALFYLASKDFKNAPSAIAVLGITFLGLSYINISSDLNSLLTMTQSTLIYWMQTLFIGLYLCALIFLYLKTNKNKL